MTAVSELFELFVLMGYAWYANGVTARITLISQMRTLSPKEVNSFVQGPPGLSKYLQN